MSSSRKLRKSPRGVPPPGHFSLLDQANSFRSREEYFQNMDLSSELEVESPKKKRKSIAVTVTTTTAHAHCHKGQSETQPQVTCGSDPVTSDSISNSKPASQKKLPPAKKTLELKPFDPVVVLAMGMGSPVIYLTRCDNDPRIKKLTVASTSTTKQKTGNDKGKTMQEFENQRDIAAPAMDGKIPVSVQIEVNQKTEELDKVALNENSPQRTTSPDVEFLCEIQQQEQGQEEALDLCKRSAPADDVEKSEILDLSFTRASNANDKENELSGIDALMSGNTSWFDEFVSSYLGGFSPMTSSAQENSMTTYVSLPRLDIPFYSKASSASPPASDLEEFLLESLTEQM